ncbi:FtsX-like permease family protein [Anaerovorax odorimutans]|uniref:FtsX-like permease family protein n=1 Tax=Anaerovorax odorimutans TaxID=109327 RepID=A0ABT1RRC4_9FIRM|nr:FtsX-like permease family protein [Anaerovorax odorimutans]MCQ4637742.1 FtsX-like permease family protein [Anaerovorax odorimutans]
MNIFNKVTVQSLKKSRARTIVTIIGVVLSAAMITAVVTFGVSLLNYMEKGAAQKYGDWHVGFLDADKSFVQEQTASHDVEKTITFENIGYGERNDSKDKNKPYFFIAGFSDETFHELPVTLLSGRMPKNSREILVPGGTAAKDGGEIAIGSKLSLSVGNRMKGGEKLSQTDPYDANGEMLVTEGKRTYKVVGICKTPDFERESAPGHTLITKSDTGDKANDFSLFVKLKNPRDVHSYASDAAGNHGCIFNDNVLRFMGISESAGDKLFNALLYSVGVIVVAIIMIGSVFLIYNAFNISLNERIQQFGILASVGATAKQLRNSVLFEGLCIGVIGTPIGIAVGIGSIGLVISVVSKNFGDILYSGVPLTLNVSLLAILSAAIVSMVTILISAYIPAKKAANTPVMECIRQSNEIKVESRAMKISKLTQRLCGLEGTLALKNFKRNKKRYRSIVLSLVLSIVLFVSTSAFVSNLKQMAEHTKAVTDYDIGLGTRDMEDSEMLRLYSKLKTAEGVYKSSYQSIKEYSCTVRADQLSDAYWEAAGERPSDRTVNLPMEIQFLDDSSYLKIVKSLELPAEEYTGKEGKLVAVAKMEDETGQAEGVHQLKDMFKTPSQKVTLIPQAEGKANTAAAKKETLTCVEFVPPDSPPIPGSVEQRTYTLAIIAPYSLMEKMLPSDEAADTRVKGLTFQSENPSRSAAEMKTMIERTGVTAAYTFMNTSEMLNENRNYIFIANVFAYTFIIMISLIAVANVFNTISTNIKLRRRELAMLRSVGMADRDFNKMMRFECAFYGIRALLFGIPIAFIASWLIYKGMFVGGADSISFSLPWASMGISVLSVFLVIFVTMMYAVSKIKKENIIDSLRDDMT